MKIRSGTKIVTEDGGIIRVREVSRHGNEARIVTVDGAVDYIKGSEGNKLFTQNNGIIRVRNIEPEDGKN